jgi:hypothetical protein
VARRLRVNGRLARAATGRVRVTWSARRSGHRIRRATTIRPRAGRIAVRMRLPRGAGRLRRQRVVLSYAGDGRHAPARVRRRVTSR